MKIISHRQEQILRSARLLLEKSIPKQSFELLKRDVDDVTWIGDLSPGATDQAVINRAAEEKRILITCDKDFGELVYAQNKAGIVGIILLRVSPGSPTYFYAKIIELFRDYGRELPGSLVVVEEGRIRKRRLPRP